MKILIADSDREAVQLLVSTFLADPITVLAAADGEVATQVFNSQHPDLVLISRSLPKCDGAELLREFRQHAEISIIMLNDHDDEDEVVRAFEFGADDCLSKPLRPRELRARSFAALRRVRPPASPSNSLLEMDGVSLDSLSRRVTVQGRPVHLSRTEFALLECLMLNHNRVVNLPDLVSRVWGYDGKENENVVKVAISRLRHKIESDPARPRHIVNVPGVGYMFQEERARGQSQSH